MLETRICSHRTAAPEACLPPACAVPVTAQHQSKYPQSNDYLTLTTSPSIDEWVVFRTKPQHETLAESQLNEVLLAGRGVTSVYLPRFHAKDADSRSSKSPSSKSPRFTRPSASTTCPVGRPLFPGYLFCRLNWSLRSAAFRCSGLLDRPLIRFGSSIASCADVTITSIRAMIEARAYRPLSSQIYPNHSWVDVRFAGVWWPAKVLDFNNLDNSYHVELTILGHPVRVAAIDHDMRPPRWT